MIDHVSYSVSNYETSRDFFKTALAPLGYELSHEFGGKAGGFGIGGKPEFWISEGETPRSRVHLAFRVDTHRDVEAFYEAAIAAGGEDNGKPGLRAHYHPDYYGAFVLDPDGHNIEAVCHTPR